MSTPDLRQVLSKLDEIRADVILALRTQKPGEMAVMCNNITMAVKEVFQLTVSSAPRTKKDALDCKLYFIYSHTSYSHAAICTMLKLKIKRAAVNQKIRRIRNIIAQPRIDLDLSEKIKLIEIKIKSLSHEQTH